MKTLAGGLLALGAAVLSGAAEAKVDVMAVYYPHWHRYAKGDEWFGADLWKQGEWTFVKSAKPLFPGHCQPLVPYGGYRDESNPKDMEVDIALAANAGIDVFLYDYYYYDGQVTQEAALEKGFLGAANRNRMKFALMWCYHERRNAFRPKMGEPLKTLMPLAHTPEEFLGLVDLSIERYFHRPEYYRKDGSLFFSIYNAGYFLECVGTNEVKTAIAEARRRVRAAGLGELHLNGQNPNVPLAKVLKDVGFDSLTHYGNSPWGLKAFCEQHLKKGVRVFDRSYASEGARKTWASMREAELPYIPSVSTGWDPSPRCRPEEPFPWKDRTYPYNFIITNSTPNTFEADLRAAKEYAETDPRRPGIVYINGWNEYTEGAFLVPNNFTADGLLRAVAAVFGRRPATEYTYVNPSSGKLLTVPAATHENVAYGPHPKQKVDLWLPKGAGGKVPLLVYIHGGGWSGGAMCDAIIGPKIEALLKKNVAVVCVGYRYLRETERGEGVPPVKGCIDDVAAALRFLKARADAWGLDVSRLGLAGGSAGACSALILAYRDGNAFGVKALAPMIPQTSMDPAEMRTWIPNSTYGAHAFGYKSFEDWLKRRDEHPEWIAAYSPAALARAIDPAKAPKVILRAERPKPDALPKDPTHASAFSWKFAEICKARGLPCDLQEKGDALLALADVLSAPDVAVAFEGLAFDRKTSTVVGLDVAGEDWGAKAVGRQIGVWTLTINPKGDVNRTRSVYPELADEKIVRDVAGGKELVWRKFKEWGGGDAVDEVRARIVRDGIKLRWRLGVTMKDGWELNMYDFPRLATRSFAGKGDKDRVVTGAAEGGVMKDVANGPYALPGYGHEKDKDVLVNMQLPGTAAQLFCRYDDERLFYFACENEFGGDDALVVMRYKEDKRIESLWRHRMRATGRFEMDFDVVTAALAAKPGLPCDWYDAADLYREWASKTHFCARTLLEKKELADFYRSGPIYYPFNRHWLDDPDYMAKYFAARAEEGLKDVPSVASCFGWEHWGEWVGLDYTPFWPSDDVWGKCVKVMRAAKARPFLWPSTYHYALKFRTPDYVSNAWRKPGTPAIRTKETDPWLFDHTERAIAEGIDRLGMKDIKGNWKYRVVWMGTGGDQATLCYYLDECRDIFRRTTVDPLMARGCVVMQMDQFNMCMYRCCFDPTHGHPVGFGRWRVEALRKCLDTANAQMRAVNPEACIGFEGPCQFYLDQIAMQDVRDCRSFKGDWANVFTYLYHEYVLPFQAGCHENRYWWAKTAAEGQVPQFANKRDFYDANGRATPEHALDVRFFTDWAKLYHGAGRKFLSLGRHIRPPRLICEKLRYTDNWRGIKIDKPVPAVFHAAYLAADGSKALALVNATDEQRTCTAVFPDGNRQEFVLAPREIALKELK